MTFIRGRLTQNDLPYFAFRVVDHLALVVEDHGLVGIRVSRFPGQAWLAGVSCAGEVGVTVRSAAANAPSITNYLFVMTDAGNAVAEQTKTNNVLRAPSPLVIQRVPPVVPGKLAVTAVDAPGTVVAGRSATISWTVANVGTNATSGDSWVDSAYLSYGTNLVIGRDQLLGAVLHQGSLGPGQSYTRSQTFPIPVCAIGQFYFLVLADSANK